MNNKPAIVVVAFNRPRSLKRLLDTLLKAEYGNIENVPLVISIDNNGSNENKECVKVAEDCDWPFGEKRVVYREENYGLKRHVLTCGEYVNEYGSIIMLEDDLYVSPAYYLYSKKALDYTEDDKKIGGVSLYNHLLNVHVREPFEAINDGYDNWYFQFASSWGQAFTKDQWNGFAGWLKENDLKDLAAENVPANVSSWSDKSWLKYYITYLIENDMYFLYPRVSLTTNFSEEGAHMTEVVCDLQVPLMGRVEEGHNWIFSRLEESLAVYDAFFENIRLKNNVGRLINANIIEKDVETGAIEINKIGQDDIGIDLYGYKPVNKDQKYLLSSKELSYKIVKSYGRLLRPIDANISNAIEGDSFFLYDLSEAGVAPRTDVSEKYLYNYRALKVKTLFSILRYRINQKLR